MKMHIVERGSVQDNIRVAVCGRHLRATSPLYTHMTTWNATVHNWICKDCIAKVQKDQ